MDYIEKIDKLRSQRGWTIYRLAQESGLSSQTIHQWMGRTSEPSLAGITQVCEAFGITLAEFFSNSELIEAKPEIKKLYEDWCSLTTDEQDSIKAIIKSYMNRK